MNKVQCTWQSAWRTNRSFMPIPQRTVVRITVSMATDGDHWAYVNTSFAPNQYNTSCDNCTGNTQRSTYLHHHCVLDWLEDNGFGVSSNGTMNTHPHIFVYPFPENNRTFISPDDGFVMEWEKKLEYVDVENNYKPLTVHPFKHHIYLSPAEVMVMLKQSSKRQRRRLRVGNNML